MGADHAEGQRSGPIDGSQATGGSKEFGVSDHLSKRTVPDLKMDSQHPVIRMGVEKLTVSGVDASPSRTPKFDRCAHGSITGTYRKVAAVPGQNVPASSADPNPTRAYRRRPHNFS